MRPSLSPAVDDLGQADPARGRELGLRAPACAAAALPRLPAIGATGVPKWLKSTTSPSPTVPPPWVGSAACAACPVCTMRSSR